MYDYKEAKTRNPISEPQTLTSKPFWESRNLSSALSLGSLVETLHPCPKPKSELESPYDAPNPKPETLNCLVFGVHMKPHKSHPETI